MFITLLFEIECKLLFFSQKLEREYIFVIDEGD